MTRGTAGQMHTRAGDGTPAPRRRNAPRGATLIELMVSLALLAVILSVAVGLLVGAMQSGARARARSELARQGQFLATLLNQELRLAGLGVPISSGSGNRHIDDSYAGLGATAFDTFVIVATPTAVGVIGDFPRPDAQYNALGALHGRPAGSRQNVFWHNENNGACGPDSSITTCSIANTSLFFPGEVGCTGVSSGNDRNCPWGMRRVAPAESIQIVAGNQEWTHAHLLSTYTMDLIGVPTAVLSLRLDGQWGSEWQNILGTDDPIGVSGQGWVTTIDRVFYEFANGKITRQQCWGDPDPQGGAWPPLATNVVPANPVSTPSGGSAQTCTPKEIIANNVQSATFAYFDSAGATTTVKQNVARVDYVIKLQKTITIGGTVNTTKNVVQDIVGTIRLRNI